jgi:phenylacetate-coenzyme A ligase PaaK-like adenylate-forming protein
MIHMDFEELRQHVTHLNWTKEQLSTYQLQSLRKALAKAKAHLQKFRDGEVTNHLYQDNYLLFATSGSSGQRGLFV